MQVYHTALHRKLICIKYECWGWGGFIVLMLLFGEQLFPGRLKKKSEGN